MKEDDFKTPAFYALDLDRDYYITHHVTDRAYWDGLRGEYHEKLKKLAEIYDKPLEILKLSDYLLFSTQGDRITYEMPFLERRDRLMWVAVMEAIENEGRYFDKLLDTLWATLEETTWSIPAHYNRTGVKSNIPMEGINCIELYSGMTGCYVSTVYAMFREKLDAISPEIGNRIRRRIRYDILEDFMKTNHGWSGYVKRDRPPNNWNPWCVSNVVRILINLGNYGDYEYKVLARGAEIIYNYYSNFPDDGGCDEGVGYWNVASGMMLEWLNDMYHLTKGRLDELKSEKAKRLAEFCMNTYVSGEHKLGFSDLTVKNSMNWGLLYYVGKVTGNERVLAFAKMCYEENRDEPVMKYRNAAQHRMLYMAEAMQELPKLNLKAELSFEHYYESIHMLIARQLAEAPFGLFLAAKANHNMESHNHLDTGNYIVYKNQVPFLVDVGSMVYTAQSFSSSRYKIWSNRSEYHNLPVIGDAVQQAGREFAAEGIEHIQGGLRSNLKKAYDCDFIDDFVREVYMNREKGEIVLKDSLMLAEEKEVSFVFME